MLQTKYKFGEVLDLASQIKQGEDKVQFDGIFSNENGGIMLLAFKAGQALDTHLAPAEVMIYVLEGEVVFTIQGDHKDVKAGEFLLLGEGVAHSVMAKADSKVMLVKVKSDK